MRQLILVVVLVAAAFLGGAFVNGPGLQWAQTRVLRSLGLNNGGEITSVDLKSTASSEASSNGSVSAKPEARRHAGATRPDALASHGRRSLPNMIRLIVLQVFRLGGKSATSDPASSRSQPSAFSVIGKACTGPGTGPISWPGAHPLRPWRHTGQCGVFSRSRPCVLPLSPRHRTSHYRLISGFIAFKSPIFQFSFATFVFDSAAYIRSEVDCRWKRQLGDPRAQDAELGRKPLHDGWRTRRPRCVLLLDSSGWTPSCRAAVRGRGGRYGSCGTGRAAADRTLAGHPAIVAMKARRSRV